MRLSSPICLLAFAACFLVISHAFVGITPIPMHSTSLCRSRHPVRIIVSMADGEGGETKPKGKGWVRVGYGEQDVRGHV